MLALYSQQDFHDLAAWLRAFPTISVVFEKVLKGIAVITIFYKADGVSAGSQFLLEHNPY